jgi:hypothetical protein
MQSNKAQAVAVGFSAGLLGKKGKKSAEKTILLAISSVLRVFEAASILKAPRV